MRLPCSGSPRSKGGEPRTGQSYGRPGAQWCCSKGLVMSGGGGRAVAAASQRGRWKIPQGRLNEWCACLLEARLLLIFFRVTNGHSLILFFGQNYCSLQRSQTKLFNEWARSPALGTSRLPVFASSIVTSFIRISPWDRGSKCILDLVQRATSNDAGRRFPSIFDLPPWRCGNEGLHNDHPRQDNLFPCVLPGKPLGFTVFMSIQRRIVKSALCLVWEIDQ